MEVTTKERKPKSVPVPKETMAWFRKYANSFHTWTELYEESGLRHTAVRNILNGRCSPDTLQTIEQLKNKPAA